MQNPFAALDERLSNIEQYLLKLSENLQSIGSVTANAASPSNEADLLNVSQASSLLGIATQTLYTNTSKIPHLKRHGRLYFRRAELIDYLESGRVKGGGK